MQYLFGGTVKEVTKVNRIGTLGGREYGYHADRNSAKIARGSDYVGSWHDCYGFLTKSFLVNSSMSGTFQLHMSLYSGMGVQFLTGTYLRRRVGAGSFTTFSITEACNAMRWRFFATGTSSTGKGTLTIGMAKQA